MIPRYRGKAILTLPPRPPKHPETKHRYDCVVVMFWEEKVFSVDKLREAVELLRTAPHTKSTGLVAVTHVNVPEGRLLTEPRIPYKNIEGKTPRELWSLFDSLVDQQVESWNHPP